MSALPPPIAMHCENCGQPVGFDPKHGVIAHSIRRSYVRWSCPDRRGSWATHRGRTTLGTLGRRTGS